MINTCEEYVLDRLTKLDSEVTELCKLLATATINYEKLYNAVKPLVTHRDYGHDSYVSFDSVWKNSKSDAYAFFVKLFNLTPEEEPDDEN